MICLQKLQILTKHIFSLLFYFHREPTPFWISVYYCWKQRVVDIIAGLNQTHLNIFKIFKLGDKTIWSDWTGQCGPSLSVFAAITSYWFLHLLRVLIRPPWSNVNGEFLHQLTRLVARFNVNIHRLNAFKSLIVDQNDVCLP